MSAAFADGDRVTLHVNYLVDPPAVCEDPRVVISGVIDAVLPCYWLAFPDGRPAVPWPVPGHRLSRGWPS